MPMRMIHLNGHTVTYTLKRSERRRTIGLQVGLDGVTVILPDRAHERDAVRALQNRADWVLKSLAKWEDYQPPPTLKGEDGESIGYMGKTIRLTLKTHARARTRIDHTDDALTLWLDDTLDPSLISSTVTRAVDRWRRKTALDLMKPKIEHYARELGRQEPPVSVRVNRSRWGSCSSDGSIRMNARLIAFDDDLIDYVCAHEACHLIEMNHSKRFYALLDKIMPDHRARSKRLKQQSPPGMDF